MLSRSVMSNAVNPGAVAQQTSLSMGLPRQEYWGGLPLPSPAGPPDPGTEPESPALVGGFFALRHLGSLKHTLTPT